MAQIHLHLQTFSQRAQHIGLLGADALLHCDGISGWVGHQHRRDKFRSMGLSRVERLLGPVSINTEPKSLLVWDAWPNLAHPLWVHVYFFLFFIFLLLFHTMAR